MRCRWPPRRAAPAGARRGPPRPAVVESVPAAHWHGPPATCEITTPPEHGVECTAPHGTTPDRLALHTRGVGVLITRTCARLFTRCAHHGSDAGGQLRSDPSSDVGRIGLPFVWEPACEQLLLLGYDDDAEGMRGGPNREQTSVSTVTRGGENPPTAKEHAELSQWSHEVPPMPHIRLPRNDQKLTRVEYRE